jgi:hypothetical protein
MKFALAIFIMIAAVVLIPSHGHTSSNERARTPPPAARIQKAEVYHLVYIVDQKGRMVLVRHNNSRGRRGAKVLR